ncbi:hypothetical protein PanWU01x14_182740 [Parasponia andersonii]|uniref:Uncharacterized protein n=1 Tax=Parasponia andersonii TaxID=3476 RepID=A0A2P5C5B0_PARAD|nr:hypothetical protein PanWU01x14_182740 [Parasponia andersonii]
MSMISCFFIFLLCLSKQGSCKARHFGARGQKGIFAAEHFHYSGKGMEKVQLQMDSSKGGIAVTKQGGNSVADKRHAGATAQENVKEYSSSGTSVKEPLNHKRAKISGKEIFESLSHVGLPKATQIKELRRRGLFVKEAVDFNTTNKVEDQYHVVVKDYEPPHGTPPIHNKET